jgi:hypothetical protein
MKRAANRNKVTLHPAPPETICVNNFITICSATLRFHDNRVVRNESASTYHLPAVAQQTRLAVQLRKNKSHGRQRQQLTKFLRQRQHRVHCPARHNSFYVATLRFVCGTRVYLVNSCTT